MSKDVQSRLLGLENRQALADFDHGTVADTLDVATLTTELLRLAAKAEAMGTAPGLSVARAALMDAAKLNGLVIEQFKGEMQERSTFISDRPMTEAEWEKMVDQHKGNA